MHSLIHARRRNTPNIFQGRSSRIYDLVSRRVLRGMYRRLAADVAGAAPNGGTVLDIGTGPGVLLVELAARRPDLRLTGVDLSADMIRLGWAVANGDAYRSEEGEAELTRRGIWQGAFERPADWRAAQERSASLAGGTNTDH